jgi:hypothetical protein
VEYPGSEGAEAGVAAGQREAEAAGGGWEGVRLAEQGRGASGGLRQSAQGRVQQRQAVKLGYRTPVADE